ncbi:metalloregulator ArsR/SmtB family transcription factor [Chromohalobacter moromii]|uniref:Metalloregulator ArsR/SmtB family transcription factor n=2 Tax=Chromohalobacter moromii TaxID=2860329 RepID=A0A9X2X468_9GAMM|nr:metalloregulator ArsR/SmtB family transcription factor [Chromohalobacter moromii]
MQQHSIRNIAMPINIDKLLRVVANPSRAYILDMLESRGEMNVTEINAELDLSQSALSQHLKPMRDVDAVQTRRASQTIYYRIADDPALRELIEWRRRYRR